MQLNHAVSQPTPNAAFAPMPVMATVYLNAPNPNGFIPLAAATFASLQWQHFMSDVRDTPLSKARTNTDSQDTWCGYTEWVSRSTPSITLGWDWTLNPLGYPLFIVNGLPSSNAQLLDIRHMVLSPSAADAVFQSVVGTLDWQISLSTALAQQYT